MAKPFGIEMIVFIGFYYFSSLLGPTIAAAVSCREDVKLVLESPRVTNWGTWTSWTYCPSGTAVTGMEMRIERPAPKNDDTAANSVKLICSDGSILLPHGGYWGNWETAVLTNPNRDLKSGSICGHAIGFQVRVEQWADDQDDTSLNNIKLFCDENSATYDSLSSFLQVNDMPWGWWQSTILKCPAPSRICGVRVQVEEPQGSGDDTALNNVDMACC